MKAIDRAVHYFMDRCEHQAREMSQMQVSINELGQIGRNESAKIKTLEAKIKDLESKP